MSCEAIREDLAAYARGEIEGERHDEIERHLGECAACRRELQEVQQVLDSVAAADEGSVRSKCMRIIAAAHKARASDIHLLPGQDGYTLRFRVDGVLQPVEQLPRPLGQAVVAHVKALSGMDVAEARVAQDGRYDVRYEGVDIDIRTSCMPTVFGEKITMRLLCRSEARLDIGRLGLSESQLEGVREFLSAPAGLFIATGPTGSGKTTLLYSMLRELDAERLSICTIEDPVEYALPGVAQTPVNRSAGLGFARAVRQLLRSDPDVIMCGEIRDLETAEVLIQAAVTGHLVLSPLHTNDTPSATRRLMDMGVEPFLIADTVSLICATRLIRTICEACKEEHTLTGAEAKWLESLRAGALTAYEGRGCEECGGTGYRGRTGLFELLKMTDALRERVIARAGADEVDQVLRASGHATLLDHGLGKVRAGATTLQEVASLARGL